MFIVNNNWTIKMNRGDEAQFPLFINNGDRVKPVRYEFEEQDGCEIYFYLLPPHASLDDFILKKTYTTDGFITTEKRGCEPETLFNETNLNENKDLVISLSATDTDYLDPGEYTYVVRAKILTSKINSKNLLTTGTNAYTTLQVTNKYPFYILDDEVNRLW